MEKFLGKVVGEFVCDEIERPPFSDLNEFCHNACLTSYELYQYTMSSAIYYGWHISDLKIYDKPKELGEFIASTPKNKFRAHGDNLTRPPQSWCYVEV